MRKIIICLSFIFSLNASAGTDIGFGTIKGIKQYDSSTKYIKVYFNSDAANVNEDCNLEATITYSVHDEASVNRMLSIALSAYMAGKKVRINSSVDSCEADFIAIQESYF
jgi:hypothetical protein